MEFYVPKLIQINNNENGFLEVINNILLLNQNEKIVMITSKGISSLYSDLLAELLDWNYNLSILYIEGSLYSKAKNIADYILSNNIQYVFGFGGGKVLDVAKYAAFLSKKKYIALPTSLSNDGIASPIAVLKFEDGKTKSIGCKPPYGIIINTLIIQNAPDSLVLSGICDTLSNYTALFDWRLDHLYNNSPLNDFAFLLSEMALNSILNFNGDNIKSEDFIQTLARSIVISGLAMEIAGSSRPCSGSEHLFSHSLDQNYNLRVSHGYQVALGAVASCIFQDRSYESIISLIKRYSINLNPIVLGISKEIFIDAWVRARETRPDRYTILNQIDLNSIYLSTVYDKLTEILR